MKVIKEQQAKEEERQKELRKGSEIDQELAERLESRKDQLKVAESKNRELKNKLNEYLKGLERDNEKNPTRGVDEESQGSEKILDD